LLRLMPKTVTDSQTVRVTILGTGTSTGVPVLTCDCEVCTSSNPKDRRLRCSCFVSVGDVNLLIDAGPDFRQQAMRAEIKQVDAVLITHHHFDHVVGLDDLRPFLFDKRTKIPCFTVGTSAAALRNMFGYIFRDGSYPGVPRLELHEVEGPFVVSNRSGNGQSVEVTPIPAVHGSLHVLGFRIGRFAYMTDVSDIPYASMGLLEDLDVLVLDALRDRPHPMHMTIEQSITLAKSIGARKTYFTHMSHEILHTELEARLPQGMAPAFDGLQFEAGL